MAGPGDVHRYDSADRPRTRRHDHDPVSQVHGLVHPVGHEKDGGLVMLPDAQQLPLQLWQQVQRAAQQLRKRLTLTLYLQKQAQRRLRL